MPADDPKVSVCIPTYNGAQHVGEAVSSVLGQTCGDFELLVRDDGSSDGTVELVQSFDDPRISLVVNDRNVGPGENWNRMLADARGSYVKVMGQDDVLHPTCLSEQVRVLEDVPAASFTACRRDVIDTEGRVLFAGRGLPRMAGVLAAAEVLPRVVASGGNPIGEPVTVLARRQAFDRIGGFRADAAYVIDLDCWARLLELGPMVALPRTLCAFRVAAGSWSMSLASQQAKQTGLLQRELRQRHPEHVPGIDYVRGRALAVVMSLARRLVYLRLAARARRQRKSGYRNPRQA